MRNISKSPVRWLVLAGLLFTLIFQSGCGQSAEDKLIGRWYSREMTIRFREDEGFIWNSTQGLALGRYEFSGKTRRTTNEEAEPNLYVDVIRNNERVQAKFEVSFLGNDRMRLEIIPDNADPARLASTRRIVLKRANDTLLGGEKNTVAKR